jgi:hypothetical protein
MYRTKRELENHPEYEGIDIAFDRFSELLDEYGIDMDELIE